MCLAWLVSFACLLFTGALLIQIRKNLDNYGKHGAAGLNLDLKAKSSLRISETLNASCTKLAIFTALLGWPIRHQHQR